MNFFLQPDSRPLFYQFIAELKESCSQAVPTPTHHFLKDLAKEGRLSRWYTQNIDCLEEQLGLNCWSTAAGGVTSISQNTVVSLHGTLSQVSCTLCKVSANFTKEHMNHFKSGKEVPCKSCAEASELRLSLGRRKLRSGFLRPDIVLYNEPHPYGETIADFVCADMAKQPNLLLVMGTSLKIAGLKKMIKDFAKGMKSRVGGENNLIIYVNKTPCSRAEWQNVFDFELIGECDEWITFLSEEYEKIKRFPKSPVKPTISQFIPSSPLRSPPPPIQPKYKKKKSVSASAPTARITASPSNLPEIPLSPIRDTTRRIDEFFTPIKSILSGRASSGKDSAKLDKIVPVPVPPTRRVKKKTSELAM